MAVTVLTWTRFGCSVSDMALLFARFMPVPCIIATCDLPAHPPPHDACFRISRARVVL